MNTIAKLRAEYDDFCDAYMQRLAAAIKKELPIGKRVTWWAHSKHPQFGRVTRHGYGGTVFVKNDKSGAETRRDAWAVTPLPA